MTKKKQLLFLSIALFFSFIFFSYFVAKENFTKFDFNTTVKFQNHIPHQFDFIFSIFSILGLAEITGLIWVILFVLMLTKKYWKTAVSLFLLPVALTIEVFGKVFVFHPAPPHLFYRGVIHFNFPSDFVHTDYSYPSGHVTRTAFLISFLMIWIYFKLPKPKQLIYQSTLALILLLMLISRIYLGEHWVSDVIGGLLLGLSTGILSAITIPLKKNV